MKRLIGVVICCLCVALPAAAQLTAEEEQKLRLQESLDRGDPGPALTQLLDQMQRQQTMLDRMSDLMDRQRQSINELSATVDTQDQRISELSQKLDDQETRLASGSGVLSGTLTQGLVSYSADAQYESAYSIYRAALFDVRRSQAEPYFRRAIEEFRAVVDQFPQAEKADDAQYRICKILTRYLEDREQAIPECRKFLAMFEGSEYIMEVRGYLQQLGVGQ